MRIGLLLPNSLHIDRLAVDVKRCFSQGLQRDIELVIETTPHNESAPQVEAKLLDLAVKDEVDAVVLPLNPGLMPNVAKIAVGQQVPVIALTMGEDIFDGDVQPPWVFVNSLNLWRSAWLTGWWAAKTYGPAAVVFSAAHDGGYGVSGAFAMGLEAAGGDLLATVPGSFTPDLAGARRSVESISDLDPDFHMFTASGDTLAWYGEAKAQLGTTAPGVELAPISYFAGGARSVELARAPIQPSVAAIDPSSEHALGFIDRFVTDTGRPAHMYALLAYEAGHLLADALDRIDGPVHAKALCSALIAAEFDGPRGRIRFDADTQEVVTPQYLLSPTRGGDGLVVMEGELVEGPMALSQNIAKLRSGTDKHGWLNPYLIA